MTTTTDAHVARCADTLTLVRNVVDQLPPGTTAPGVDIALGIAHEALAAAHRQALTALDQPVDRIPTLDGLIDARADHHRRTGTLPPPPITPEELAEAHAAQARRRQRGVTTA